MNNIEHYKELEKELLEIRAKHNGEESDEEEIHMCRMDDVWYSLTDEEIELLRG